MKLVIDEIKKHKKYVVNLILAFISYLAILIYFKIIFSNDSYNFLLLVLFFLLFAFYNKYLEKYKKLDKRTKRFSLILSIILAVILATGSLVSSHIYATIGLIFTAHTILYLIIGIVGFTLLFKIPIGLMLKRLPNITVKENRKMSKKGFWIIFAIFIVCWLPYFLRYFPAVMTPDSYYIIHYVENLELNDFHAFGHTWFFGIFYYIGKAIFHNMNLAVAFYIIIQMFISSAIFTYMINFLYEKAIKNIYLIIITLFLALSPLFAIYSITLWRDILFGLAFVTLFMSLYQFVDNKYELKSSIIIMYILSVLVILFFRNNGIYIILLFIPFFIWLAKNHRRIILFGNLGIVILYFAIKGPVFTYFGVEKTTSVEAFSMPLQQISRVIVNDGDIDKKTYDYLSKLLDIDKVKETYNPTISDYVKRATDNDELSNNKIKFFTTWLKIGIDNPRLYIDSYLLSTLGYWYPDVIYWATAGESKSIFKDVDVYSDPIILDNVSFDELTSREIPLSSMLWSIGTMFIILLVSTFIMLYKKKGKYLLAYIPLYCLWLSLMLASPVFAELRYIYGLFACVPLLLLIPFVKTKNN